MPSPDALVLGGGIVGLASARELAGRGLKVEVLERLSAGAEASLAAAGMLAPLAEAPQPGPLLDACREARDLWRTWARELEEEVALPIEHDASGALVMALDEAEEEALELLARSAAELGEPVESLSVGALLRRVPDASPTVRRAFLLPGEHRVDNVRACAVLARSAGRRGVVFSYGHEVERVVWTEGGVRVEGRGFSRDAGLLVLAAGAWSGRIPGLPALPVRPVRGQMLLLGGVEWPWKGTVRAGRWYAVRRGETGLLVGATTEEAGFHNTPTVEGASDLLRFAGHAFPGLRDARVEGVWAGLRPGTPDDLPILGRLPGLPAIAATGHYRNGILLAPWTARRVAELATGGGGDDDDRAFSPTRFLKDLSLGTARV